MRSAAAAFVATLTSTILFALVPTATQAAFPGGNGKILFSGAPTGSLDWSIWSMDPDGGHRTQLTHFGPGVDSGGRFSSDGTKVVFERRADADQVTDLWVMAADGSDEEELGPGVNASWSPDGATILFADTDDGLFYDLWTMAADGSDREQLTFTHDMIHGVWSPDGGRIAYSTQSGTIGTIKADGSDRRQLHAGNILGLDWSPDGKRIAFGQSTAPSQSEIFTMPAGGGTLKNVTGGYAGLPRLLSLAGYSPDGSRLLFAARDREGGAGPLLPADPWSVPVTGAGPALNHSDTSGFDESVHDWQPAPPYPFGDIATSTFVKDIVWLADTGLTSGCAPILFCPDGPVTRAQMASFLARALDLPATPTDSFTDDDDNTHENDINRLAAAGLTAGCGPGTFCPSQQLTRAQAASFLARALNLPASPTDHFSDDEGNTHEIDINRLAAAGITSGCSATSYCPAVSVTRGQLAAFLRRAFDE